MPDSTPWYLDGDPWQLLQQRDEPERNRYFETIFSQANGYMGVRAYGEEDGGAGETCREGYLAGVFAEVDAEATAIINGDFAWPVLEMVSLPDLFHTRIDLDGTRFDPTQGTVESFRRDLDMRTGMLRRDLTWRDPTGRRTHLVFERMLSAADPHLAAQRVAITPQGWSGPIVVERVLDGDVVTRFRCGDRARPHLPQRHFHDHRCRTDATLGVCGMRTEGTDHEVAVASAMPGAGTEVASRTTIHQRFETTAADGETVCSERVAAVAHDRDQGVDGAPDQRAAAAARVAAERGFDAVAADSAAVWAERWRVGAVSIEGDARDDKLLRFNVFQLFQMAPYHADNLSLPARAYAYNRYRGTYFWDTEIFLVPFYQWVAPAVARNLLAFRHRTLDGARRNAAVWGGDGALFPWMTDSDSGLDNSIDARVDRLIHQTPDIAHTIDEYARVTGDEAFMRRYGLEVVVEVARFVASRLERGDDGRYHIAHTIGPDEDRDPGLDNGFTMLMARRALRVAADWLERLQVNAPATVAELAERCRLAEDQVARWRALADAVHVPEVPDLGIPLQDEYLLDKKTADVAGWRLREAPEHWAISKQESRDYRLIKQADIVLAAFLLEDEFTPAQRARIYDFYEPMTLHISSLSWNTHAIVAARLGRVAEAYDYYGNCAGLDLDDVKEATADGLHAAALGGGWQAVAFGFCGLHRTPDGQPACAPHLPPNWNRVRFGIERDGVVCTVTAEADGSWSIEETAAEA